MPGHPVRHEDFSRRVRLAGRATGFGRGAGRDRRRPRRGARHAIPRAAAHWTQADCLIRETGYQRRKAELHLLEARLQHHQARPAQARTALARAESALRARGQWGLWPALRQVAAELGLPAPVMDP